MKKVIFALLTFAIALSASPLSFAGNEGSGGGSHFEERVDLIREDLKSWIEHDYARALFPAGESGETAYRVYRSKMIPLLGKEPLEGSAQIEFITEANERLAFAAHDDKHIARIDDTFKVCRYFDKKRQQRPRILCVIETFPNDQDAKPSQARKQASEQYRLIHHEFASLAGQEINTGASSDYHLSNLMTDFLKPETIVRLSASNVRTPPTEACDPNKVRWMKYPYSCLAAGVEWRVEEDLFDGKNVYRDMKSGLAVTAPRRLESHKRELPDDPGTFLDLNLITYDNAVARCHSEPGFELPNAQTVITLISDGVGQVIYDVNEDEIWLSNQMCALSAAFDHYKPGQFPDGYPLKPHDGWFPKCGARQTGVWVNPVGGRVALFEEAANEICVKR